MRVDEFAVVLLLEISVLHGAAERAAGYVRCEMGRTAVCLCSTVQTPVRQTGN